MDKTHPERGCHDYMDLFVDEAPWPIAAMNVQVFKLDESVADALAPAQLQRIFDNLDRRHISLCIEARGLSAPPKVGPRGGVLPLGSPARIARKIRDAGGIVRFLVFDEPYGGGVLSNAPQFLHYSIDQVAEQLTQYINEYRTIFPGVIFGDIEPVGGAKTWLEAFHRASGVDMSFLHLNVNYHDPAWATKAKDLEDYCRKHGISFGIIYTGDEGQSADEQWLQSIRDRMAIYETEKSGHPDDAVIESWQLCPRNLLPETDTAKFTQLVNYYANMRTRISLDKPDPVNQFQISGKVLYTNGKPAVGMSMKLWVKPDSPNALHRDGTANSIIPPDSKHATGGVRINTKSGLRLAEETETDAEGVFKFKHNLSPGNFLRISAIGDREHWPLTVETTIANGAGKEAGTEKP